MGCVSSKEETDLVDKYLSEMESELLYSQHSAELIDVIHRKYSHKGIINESQWRFIYRALDLAPNKPDLKNAGQINYYYSLFKKNSVFQLSEMLVLGILLGNGDLRTKSKLIFEAFDERHLKVVDKYAVGRIYDCIYKISVKRLEDVIKTYAEVPLIELETDFENLKGGRDGFREDFLKSVLENADSVSIEGFIETVMTTKFSQITSCYGFRKLLREYKLLFEGQTRSSN